MKEFPSIPGKYQNIPICAFDKLDGSNIRAEWHPKKGFWKFGSKTKLIDESTLVFGEAVPLVKALEGPISDALRPLRVESALVFFEFYGPSSFAGFHLPEPHQVKMIDVNLHKRGFMNPSDFIKFAPELPRAELLYRGNCNASFVESVKSGTLEGMSNEGVVCKTNRLKPSTPITYFKIKNVAWIEKLRARVSPEEFELLV